MSIIFSVLKFTVVLSHTPFFSLFDTENPGDSFMVVLFIFLVTWEFMCKGLTIFRLNIFGKKTPSVVDISYSVINRCVVISGCLTVSDARSFDPCLHQLFHWGLWKVDFPNCQLYIAQLIFSSKEKFSIINWNENYYQSKDLVQWSPPMAIMVFPFLFFYYQYVNVLVTVGYHNRIPQSGWHKQQKLTFSQFQSWGF